MKKLFISFILLNALALSVLASCPDYPTIPTSSTKLLTSTSAGMTNFPSSTKQLSITMAITPGAACTAGSVYNLFSMSVGTTPEYLTMYVECDTLKVFLTSTWLGSASQSTGAFASAIGLMAIYVSFDLDAKAIKFEMDAGAKIVGAQLYPTITSGPSFDTNSKFYFCAGQDGASPKACTISELVFEYRYTTDRSSPVAHLGGTKPTLTAFYPLVDGSLESSIGSASDAYFGDKISNPTTGTTPTWDASDAIVTISAGQFLTFPLPTIKSGALSSSSSFSFAAWVKMTTLQPSDTTIFSMHSADGTQVGYSLNINPMFMGVSPKLGSRTLDMLSNPSASLNTWQLIGFTAYLSADQKSVEGNVVVGTNAQNFMVQNQASAFDLSTVSVLRIGGATNSFSGQVSIVRIMTPGGGTVRSSDLCSSDNSVELGVGSFAFACSGSNSLNPLDNKCYATCPDGTFSSSDPAVPLCVTCPDNCATCDSSKCLTCETNYVVDSGECKTCPDNTYYAGSTCESCPSHCKTCDGSKCLSCDSSYLLYEGGCEDSCPAKFYSDSTSCLACSSHCAECDASGCKTCDDGYQVNTDKTCKLASPTTKTTVIKSSSRLSGGAIAGIVVGSIVLIGAAGWIFSRFLKKSTSFFKHGRKVTPFDAKTPTDIEAAKTVASPTNTEAKALIAA